MKKNRSDLKVLLMQIREDPYTLEEELHEFMRYSDLHHDQFTCLNVFEKREFSSDVIEGFDALFIGGSSDATVQDPITYNFLPSCKSLVQHCYDKDIPVLASCFGFQIAVEQLGGQVAVDKANMEMGLYQIELTSAAKEDKLLATYPNIFWAVSGHKEKAIRLPKNAIHLGKTELCPFHIFTFKDKPFYAFQFHPEVNTKDLIARITRYQARYLECDDALQTIISAAVHPTHEANRLITDFVEKIMLVD